MGAKPTPKPGQIIIFDEPMRFNDGIERARFEVIKGRNNRGLAYRDVETRQVCQIPSVKKLAYRLINPVISIPEVAS